MEGLGNARRALAVVLAVLSLFFASGALAGETVPGSFDAGMAEKHDLLPFIRETQLRVSQGGYFYPDTKVIRRLAEAQPGESISTEAVQTWFGLANMPLPLVNFDGITNMDNALASNSLPLPPDTNGDVGLNHYVQIANDFFAVFDKQGKRLFGAADQALWSGFGGDCEDLERTDPIVLYDRQADRWFISQLTSTDISPEVSHYCIAVSQTPDPLGAWYRYSFKVSDTKAGDYPKFGIWPDAYYMSINQFVKNTAGNDIFVGVGAVAFDRSRMLLGQDAGYVYFDLAAVNPFLYSMLPANLNGPTSPPSGEPNYFLEFDDLGISSDRLEIWEFHVDWNVRSNSSFKHRADLVTEPFNSNMCGGGQNCIPQPDISTRVDALSDRLMYRLQYRNFGAYQTMVVNHTVDVDGTDHAGVRWYELRRIGGGWSIRQQGTYAPDADHRWMGSIAMDGDGNIALGYSVSGFTTYPSVRYTGRLAGDPLGTLPQGETTLIAGSGSQTDESGRWGDYSSMSIDPADDHTFWYTQEYYDTTGSLHGRGWKTRIGSFTFKTYTVKASAGPGGGISPSGSIRIDPGAELTLTMLPQKGYHVSDVIVDGNSVGPVTSYTFSNVSSDHTIAGVFAPDPCSATLSTGLVLHIPALSLNGSFFWMDAVAETASDGAAVIRMTDFGMADPAAFQSCEPATLTTDLRLLVPVILYDNVSGWGSFEYVPSGDGLVRFKVTDAGLY